ncbi:hypothetical protein [Pacificibacter marinus]|uniref:hypothetical protein n=1 Tax=Pacificibacter marinus TaxID=658057 RepID=UPI0027BB196D|nr:hypothetical protein [Pacificibacter marinus]
MAILIVGAGLDPKADPRPVVNTINCAPPAIWTCRVLVPPQVLVNADLLNPNVASW